MKWIKKVIPDILATLGGACVVYGGFLVANFIGWIVCGCLLVAAAVIYSRAERNGDDKL